MCRCDASFVSLIRGLDTVSDSNAQAAFAAKHLGLAGATDNRRWALKLLRSSSTVSCPGAQQKQVQAVLSWGRTVCRGSCLSKVLDASRSDRKECEVLTVELWQPSSLTCNHSKSLPLPIRCHCLMAQLTFFVFFGFSNVALLHFGCTGKSSSGWRREWSNHMPSALKTSTRSCRTFSSQMDSSVSWDPNSQTTR